MYIGVNRNMAVYKIRGCTVDDAAPLARNNMSAFWTDPHWRLYWTDWTLRVIIAECTKRMPRNLLKDRSTLRHEMAVDDAGNVLGYARWILPSRLAGDEVWASAQTPAVNAASEKEYAKLFNSARWSDSPAMALGGRMAAVMGRLTKDKDYIELEYLAVHPDNRGQGIATRLVEHGIAQAKNLRFDLIVMAYKAGVGVYQRLGFETIETLLQDDSQYGGEGEFRVYYMVLRVSK